MSVTLRGKKYSVNNVSTVSEIQKNVEALSGLTASKQGVLFQGQKLQPPDVLEDVGIEDGSVINIVPTSGSSGTKKKKKSAATTVSNNGSSSTDSETSSTSTNPMEEMLKSAGIDTAQFKDMLDSMPGSGGSPTGNAEKDMVQSMEMLQKMMSSPMFQQFMNDPERLEQSRQMILQNPLMKSMMASLPGFDDILNDKEKWRETMVAAANMYQSMGSEMMEAMAKSSSSMMNGAGMGNMMNPGFGLPDMGQPGAFAGLDELSEGDD